MARPAQALFIELRPGEIFVRRPHPSSNRRRSARHAVERSARMYGLRGAELITLTDVSLGGCALESDVPLTVRHDMKLQFALPNGKYIEAVVELVRVRELDDGTYEAGARFVRLEQDFVDALKEFVSARR